MMRHFVPCRLSLPDLPLQGWAAALALAAIFAGCAAQDGVPIPACREGPADDTLTRFLEDYYAGVARETLPNGLEIIVKEKHTAPIVNVQAWVRAGSIFEGDHLGSGLSHFLEHMLFNGTDEIRGDEGEILFPAFERGDVRRRAHDMGGYADAYTSQDRTVFHCTVLSRHAREALRMIGHLVTHATLDEKIRAEEIKTLSNEYNRNRDNPACVFKQRVYEAAYRTHAARIPVIGYMANLESLERDDLLAYYRERYVPNNMALIVAGDVEAGEVVAWAREAFAGGDGGGSFRRRASPSFRLPPEPRRNSPCVDFFEHPGVEAITGQIAFQTVGIHHPHLYALDVLADILGRTSSSVLHQKLVAGDPEGGVISLKAGHNTPLYRGRLYVNFALRPESDLFRFRDRVVAELDRFKADPLDGEAIRKAADRIGGRIVRSLSKVEKVGTNLGKTWLNALPDDFDLVYLENLRKVTPEDVMEAARRYLNANALILVAMGPDGFVAGLPRGSAQPRAPRIEAPVQHHLSNGLPVILLKNEEFPVVVLHALFAGGLRNETSLNNGSFRMLSALCPLGTAGYGRGELDRLRGEKGISIKAESRDNTFSVTLSAMAGDFHLECDLLHEVLCRPAFSPEKVDRVRSEAMIAIRQAAKTPSSVAVAALRQEIFGSHPSSMTPAGTERSLQGISAESLDLLWKRTIVPGNMAISVVGNFEPEKALARLEELFGDLDGAVTATAAVTPARVEGRRSRTITLPAIHQAEAVVGFAGLGRNDPDTRILPLVTTVLNQRLLDNLRIRRGLVYLVRVYTMSGFDGGMVWIQADTRESDRVEEIVAACFEEIEILGRDLLTAAELEGARNALLAPEAFSRQDPAATAAGIALDVLCGGDSGRTTGCHEHLEIVTAEEVRRVARRVLTSDRCRSIIVRPE
jgi:zinc protease